MGNESMMQPRRKENHGRASAACGLGTGLLALLAACSSGATGSAAGGGGGGDTSASKTLTKGGKAVNVTALERWSEGVKLFKKHDKSGWKSQACEAAVGKFQAAESAQPKFAEAIYMQGLVNYKCGDRAKSVALYNKALRVNSKLCKARVGLGLDQVENGRSGRGEFERSIRDDPQCTEGYVNLAIEQRKAGDNGEALNNLRRSLAIDAQYLPAFNEMALLYLSEAADNKKKLDLAEVVCSQAQKINDEYAPVYNTWGLIDLRRDKIIEASAKFQKAFQLDGKMFEAYMNFAQITIGFRGYQDAMDAFERALKLRPESFDAQVGLGVAYRGLEQNKKAISAYEKAMKLQPNRAEPYYNLGVLWQDFQSGTEADMTKAQRYYKQFMGKAGSEPRYRDAVEDVTRRCQEKKRRRGSSKCIAGRLQNIENYHVALKEMAELEELRKEGERQMAELEAEEKKQAEEMRKLEAADAKKAEEEAKKAEEEAKKAEEQSKKSGKGKRGDEESEGDKKKSKGKKKKKSK